MLIEILVALFIGVLAGTFTGLIPGIHINLVGAFLIALSGSLFSSVNFLYLAVFIAAMAIAHTFIDFIPSVFLGCPDTDTELSVLPGHELLKQGKGYEAIMLTAYGGIMAVLVLMLIAFPAVLAIDKIQDFLNTPYVMPAILILISGSLIFLEKKKMSALLVFLLTGFLGICALNLPSLNQPLFPMLTGLFGGSMLTMSIRNKIQIPKQKIEKISPKIKKPIAGAFLGSLIASPLCSFLPGLGSGQAAVIGNVISKTDRKGFLVLIGATNTLVMGFSFISLYAISKTRTGAAAAVKEIIGELSPEVLILLLGAVLISGVISFFITGLLARLISKRIDKLNYVFLSFITFGILIISVFFISDFMGLAVLAASTFTGVYCISLGVKRTNMMGCLLIPTIIFYIIML